MAFRADRTLERLAGAEVRDGEWRAVLLFAAALFLLLAAYYVLKVVREPLILATEGAVSRSYARAFQAALLVAVVPFYSALANRMSPARLVHYVFLFFIVSLLCFVACGLAGLAVGFLFFVWLGIFSTLCIAQFWSLANDLLTETEGERLFPLVAVGGTVGAIGGAQLAAQGMDVLGVFGLMLLAAVLLAGCMALIGSGTASWRGRAGRSPATVVPARSGDARIVHDPHGGFALLARDPYLLLIACAVLLVNVVNTTGDYMLAEMVSRAADAAVRGAADPLAARQAYVGAFYGHFQTAVSLLTTLAQVLVVGRLFHRAGVDRSLFVLPVLVLLGYGSVALWPVLGLLAALKITENSTEYSLQNTLQQALFLPTSRDAKYKAKAAIDTFVVRAGDVGSAAIVYAGTALAIGVRGFAVVNVVTACAWILVVWRLARRHRRLSGIAPAAAA